MTAEQPRPGRSGLDEHAAVFVISVAAELAGMHPQTLRQYDRLGLVSPDRTTGRGRRYSARDVARLRLVQRLSQEEGINLAGIKRILELENQVQALQGRIAELSEQVTSRGESPRVFAASPAGEIVALYRGRPQSGVNPAASLVVWRPAR